jgi:AhpD family alkylhydroperoxidase
MTTLSKERFPIPTRDQVEPAAQVIFDGLQKQLGNVPNLYAVIGHSAGTLESYLAFSNAQAKGSFNAKEREAIFLAVSQANHCDYCLAVHTVVGKMNGFTEAETVQLRNGTIADKKLNVITRLAIALIQHQGKPSPDLLEEFYALGYDEGALINLVALVVDKTFTNYMGRLSGVALDFPPAPAI